MGVLMPRIVAIGEGGILAAGVAAQEKGAPPRGGTPFPSGQPGGVERCPAMKGLGTCLPRPSSFVVGPETGLGFYQRIDGRVRPLEEAGPRWTKVPTRCRPFRTT